MDNVCIFGRYHLLEYLCKQEDSVVHYGGDSETGKAVAIKLTKKYPSGAAVSFYEGNPENFPRLRFHGKTEIEGAFYNVWVTDFIEGKSLEELVEGGRMVDPKVDAVRWVIKALEPLGQLHSAGLYSGDLKPSDFILGYDGKVYLVDIDTVVKEGSVPSHVNERYSAPEIRVTSTLPCDRRADIYSMGMILLDMLIKGLRGDEVGLRRFNYDDRARYLRMLPENLGAVIGKATQYNPNDRYGNVMKFKEALQGFLSPTGRAS